MTLHPKNHWEVPQETVRVARTSFPKGNVYMKMHDELGTIYCDSDFKELFPARCGKSAISPARLALITVMQFGEGLSDSQAADAVRSRIDWKYVLGLDLTDSGFDSSVLSEFRNRLGEQELARCGYNSIHLSISNWFGAIPNRAACHRTQFVLNHPMILKLEIVAKGG